MINIVIMVHHAIPETLLSGFFSRIPEVKVVRIPAAVSKSSFGSQIESLETYLQQVSLESKDIHFFVVEANYGVPASQEINKNILDYVLSSFLNAKVIAYSSTTESLAKALIYDNRLQVMDKNNDLDKDITNISAILHSIAPEHQITIASRVHTTKTLKELLIQVNNASPPRIRAGSYIQETEPMEEEYYRPRSNTLQFPALYSMVTGLPFQTESSGQDNSTVATTTTATSTSTESKQPVRTSLIKKFFKN